MQRILALLLIVLAFTAGACATQPKPENHAELDVMFQRLQSTDDQTEARMLEVAIHRAWSRSGDAETQRLMNEAAGQIRAGDYNLALAAINKVVAHDPGYVEGWNMRAVIHYLQDDYKSALADIKRVLTLEPRHYNALAGLGRIFLALDNRKAALRAFQAALAINPHLDEIRGEANNLEDELAGIPL